MVERNLIYLSVTADTKESIGKLASLTGKSEGAILLQCIGINEINEDMLKANLAKMKVSALASYLDIDPKDLMEIMAKRA